MSLYCNISLVFVDIINTNLSFYCIFILIEERRRDEQQNDMISKLEDEVEEIESILGGSFSDVGQPVKRGNQNNGAAVLDDAPAHVDLKPQKTESTGTWSYMCTRNNNFSNRSQKGFVCVK